MNDPCYERLETEWQAAAAENDARALTKILVALIRYFKQRASGSVIHSVLVTDKLAHVEEMVPRMTTKEFLACVPQIEFARRHVAETSQSYGGGFHEAPSTEDIERLRPAKGNAKAGSRSASKKGTPRNRVAA